MTRTLTDKSADESTLVASLCAGDESAFTQR